MAYGPKIIQHFENPQNVGRLDVTKPNVGVGLSGSPSCGDVMQIFLEVDDNNIVTDAKMKIYGCGSAVSAASRLTEIVKGMSLTEASEIKNNTIAEDLALPPIKWHCSVLAEDCIQQAIADLKSKQKSNTKITEESLGKWNPAEKDYGQEF